MTEVAKGCETSQQHQESLQIQNKNVDTETHHSQKTPLRRSSHTLDDDNDITSNFGTVNSANSSKERKKTVVDVLEEQYPALRSVVVQDCSGSIVAGDGRAQCKTVDGQAWNCFRCNYPTRERGYFFEEVWDAFAACGVDPAPLLEYLRVHMPIAPAPRHVPQGRAAVGACGVEELEQETALVCEEMCSDECVLAHLLENNRANKNQCIALANLQAAAHGNTEVTPAPWKGVLRQHGGDETYKSTRQMCADGERALEIPDVVFRRIQPAYQQFNIRNPRTHRSLFEKDVRKSQ